MVLTGVQHVCFRALKRFLALQINNVYDQHEQALLALLAWMTILVLSLARNMHKTIKSLELQERIKLSGFRSLPPP